MGRFIAHTNCKEQPSKKPCSDKVVASHSFMNRCIRMKLRYVALLILSSISSVGFAQQSIECQVLRQQILQLSTAGDSCQQMRLQCSMISNPEQRNSCDLRASGCQIGQGIGGMMGAKPELEQKIAQYKSFCGG